MHSPFSPSLSVCIGSGLGSILSPFKLPYFTLPFNIATSIAFMCMRAHGLAGLPEEASGQVDVSEAVQWAQVCVGSAGLTDMLNVRMQSESDRR